MYINTSYSASLLALLSAAAASTTAVVASPIAGDSGVSDQQHHHHHLEARNQIHLAGQEPPLFSSSSRSDGSLLDAPSSISALTQTSVLKDLLNPADYEKLLQHVEGLPERRIIALSEHKQDRHVITEGQKALLTFHGIKYMDVTEEDHDVVSTASVAVSSDAFPTSWKYGRKKLDKLFYKNIDTARMKTFLQAFSSFRTRYYRSSDGRQSQLYLMQKVHEIITQKEYRHLNMTVEEFPHPWGQNSVIVKLPANNSDSAHGTVVVGAHQDSTNLLPFLSAPGADDDGSGTTTVLEVIRILTEGHYVPTSHNVEFHFYSAEEGGMLGSQAVVKDYQERAARSSHSHKVKAMLQMDMTAYVKPGTKERIGIIQDFVSPSLTEFVTRLIKEYNDIPSVETACKYACSDHSSWTKIGVPSAFAIEATFEDSNTRHIHTSGDTINVEGFSFDHMAQFVQLASAFVMELSS